MPSLKTYDLFISHAWSYNDAYYRVEKLLNDAPNFYYRNYSVPKHDPLVNPNTSVGQRTLVSLLEAQIRSVNCFLVMAGMYSSYKFWIKKGIDISNRYGKPIIKLVPRGQERVLLEVQRAAVEMVAWSTVSIVSAIRRHSI